MTWTAAQEAELRILLRRAYIRDNYRTATCKGKDAFPTADMAKRAAPKGRGVIAPYRCNSCGKWHIGSHLGPKSRNESKRIRTRNGAELEQGEA